jgi:hypothetical protein
MFSRSKKRQRVASNVIVDPAAGLSGPSSSAPVTSVDQVYAFNTNRAGRRNVSIQANKIVVQMPACAPPVLSSSIIADWSNEGEVLLCEPLAGMSIVTQEAQSDARGIFVSPEHEISAQTI